ncbi:DUF4339 domain-containing protein [Hyphomicrobium sp. 99]|uniref:DUF4339 domain-containing protein n=1 Tax=Hyphomicrobium sp. 99 TaxID=1163419 RepID=UPI001FD928C9|nr:DUF4339 domain-containing protein [Hyphomicrobium sp. 99]
MWTGARRTVERLGIDAYVCEEAMMTGQANEIQWYIARDGKQHGPLTDVEMRTFVAHNYLRLSDLIWRPGMPEWQSAPTVFPTAFEALGEEPKQAPARAQASSASSFSQPAHYPTPVSAHQDSNGVDYSEQTAPRPERNVVKRLALASVAITLIGGGAFALATYRGPIADMVSGPNTSAEHAPIVSAPATDLHSNAVAEAQPTPSPSGDSVTTSAPPAASDVISNASTTTSSVSSPEPDPTPAPDTSNTRTQVATIDPQPPAALPSTGIDGSPLDQRLQKVAVWSLIKKEYPDWYASQVGDANKLVAENKSDNEVAALLAQGLVNLRRQNADKALNASSDRLQAIAQAFLDHLKSLRAQSVSACFGFISKGETSPAVVQMMEHPETATALNAQAGAIFEAISEGTKNPVKHDSAVKSDYDLLIKELSKLGWKEEDLQVFSNPKLLAKREPEQVCKMVQEWFIAHLAVQDKAVRDRLLYETLKPVVSG